MNQSIFRRLLTTGRLPLICSAIVLYYAFHAIYGAHGLITRTDIEKRIAHKEVQLSELVAQRAEIERRIELMKPGQIDPDILDERLRLLLGYGREDEIVIFRDR